jgi:class 3 adenylate cyclase/tetratricopeptide (TPR) repeat protein
MTAPADGAFSCPSCGTPAVPGARFCFNCGTPLTAANVEHSLEPGTERRVVTVLFGDLTDFTSWAEELDPERVGVVTGRLLTALTEAVADVGGHVDKLTGDGIMAIFGAPVAHEDDPERAVRAAAAMQRAVRLLVADETGGGRALGLRVGLNTGEVLAGVHAGLTYTVIGDTVNTAARLSDVAGSGAVWAGQDTAVATMNVASWRALQPLRLKGKREPVAAYELVRLRAQGAPRPGLGEESVFVGRDAERGVLIGRVLDIIDTDRPATMVVTGEAGVGKTRLVSELGRFVAEIESSRVLWGRCTPYGEGRDLRPLADWVRTVCGITVADLSAPDRMAERVRRTVARLEPVAGAVSVEPLLALLGLTEGEAAPPRENAAPGAGLVRDLTTSAVAGLISALAAGGPVLLVVDDVQWAVPELLDALVGVASQLTGPVLLTVVGRSDLLSPAGRADWWEQLPNPELLPVLPLERASADRLLRAYLGGAELDSAVRDALLDRAEGNPFFLAELLHLLVDRGSLRREADGWLLIGELPAEVLPSGVQAVLTARFDNLEAAPRSVLRNAAVIGTRFPDAAVIALGMAAGEFPASSADQIVTEGLAVLRERDIVRSGQPGVHVFTHALARDVAYAATPKVDRAHRHAAAVAWAAESIVGPPAEIDTFVATHAERAVALAEDMSLARDDPAWQVRDPGYRALLRLAESALGADEPQSALDMFRRAVALAGDALPESDQMRAEVGIAAGHVAAQNYEEAEAALARALASEEPQLRSRALLVLADIRRRTGAESGAVAALDEALSTARAAGDDVTVAAALRQLGLVDYLAGRMAAAEARFAQAREIAERVGDLRGAGWALQHLAWSATTRGAHDVAEEALRRAAEVFTELEDNRGLSWCAGSEAFVRMLEGRLQEARDLASGLLPLGEQIGDKWGVGACLTIDAIAAAELGDPHTAASEAAEAVAAFRDIGDGWGLAMATVACGITARCGGDAKQAAAYLDEAVSVAEQGSYAAVATLATVAQGYALLDNGDVDGAESSARRGATIAAELDLEPYALAGVEVLMAQVLRARGQTVDALTILERVDSAGADAHRAGRAAPSLLFPRRQVVAHHAGVLLELGRLEEARACVERALGVPAEDVRSAVVVLRVLAAVRAAEQRLDEARDAVEEALEVAREAEYGTELRLTEELRERLFGPGQAG